MIAGIDPNTNETFVCFRVGWGWGGGVTVDPLGGRPGSAPGGSSGKSGGGGVGVWGEVAFEAGGVAGKIAGNAGIQADWEANCDGSGFKDKGVQPYVGLGPQGSLGKPSGIKAVAAAGLEVCFYGKK